MKVFHRSTLPRCRPVASELGRIRFWGGSRAASAATKGSRPSGDHVEVGDKPDPNNVKSKREGKTQTQLDEEMRRAMERIAGDGGEAGLELEDGKPVAMKRGVRENMFRYI